MTYQTLLKDKYCRLRRLVLTIIFGLTIFSCSPQIYVSVNKSYPSREDNDSVVIYKKAQDISIESEKIGTLQAPPDTAKSKFENLGGKLYVGFGIGPETGLSLFLPKFSCYIFQDRKILSTYYGVEACIGIIMRPQLSLDYLYGVKKSIFTLDTSFGVWWLPKAKYADIVTGPYFHSTINPKVGIKFWKVWLKAGPSIHLYKDYRPKGEKPAGIVNMGKIGNKYYNFEILIQL